MQPTVLSRNEAGNIRTFVYRGIICYSVNHLMEQEGYVNDIHAYVKDYELDVDIFSAHDNTGKVVHNSIDATELRASSRLEGFVIGGLPYDVYHSKEHQNKLPVNAKREPRIPEEFIYECLFQSINPNYSYDRDRRLVPVTLKYTSDLKAKTGLSWNVRTYICRFDNKCYFNVYDIGELFGHEFVRKEINIRNTDLCGPSTWTYYSKDYKQSWERYAWLLSFDGLTNMLFGEETRTFKRWLAIKLTALLNGKTDEKYELAYKKDDNKTMERKYRDLRNFGLKEAFNGHMIDVTEQKPETSRAMEMEKIDDQFSWIGKRPYRMMIMESNGYVKRDNVIANERPSRRPTKWDECLCVKQAKESDIIVHEGDTYYHPKLYLECVSTLYGEPVRDILSHELSKYDSYCSIISDPKAMFDKITELEARIESLARVK